MVFDTAVRLFPALTTWALFLIQAAFFVVIKFNDVSHLHKEVQRLGKECKGTKDKQELMDQRLARMEGKLDILVDHFIPAQPKEDKPEK